MPFEFATPVSGVSWSASQFARDVDWPAAIAQYGSLYSMARKVASRRRGRSMSRMGAKRRRIGSRSRSRGNGSSNPAIPTRRGFNAPAVSQYHEGRIQYMRHPAPRRVKSRARRAFRRAEKVIVRNWPTQMALTYYQNDLVVPQNQQQYAWFPLYSVADGRTPGIYHQLQSIKNYIGQNDLNPNVQAERKFCLKNAVLDLNLVSNGSFTTTNPSVFYPVYLEIYHLSARKNSVFDPSTCFEQGLATKSIFSVTGYTTPLPTNPYISPFDSPTFCENYIIKSVRKHVLQPGEPLDLQLRDNREYIVSSDEFWQGTAADYDSIEYHSLAKYTEGYFVVARGCTSAGPNSFLDPTVLGGLTLNSTCAVNIRYSASNLDVATNIGY